MIIDGWPASRPVLTFLESLWRTWTTWDWKVLKFLKRPIPLSKFENLYLSTYVEVHFGLEGFIISYPSCRDEKSMVLSFKHWYLVCRLSRIKKYEEDDQWLEDNYWSANLDLKSFDHSNRLKFIEWTSEENIGRRRCPIAFFLQFLSLTKSTIY